MTEEPIKIESEDVPVEVKENPLIMRVVNPHEKKSRPMTDDDFGLIDNDLKLLYDLCFVRNGLYNGCYAMSHPQVEDITPCQVFVTCEREIIVNPVITNHTKTTVDSIEGCFTFPHLPPIVVQRWHKIECDFQTVMIDPEDSEKMKLSSVQHRSLSGHWAKVWQHECQHFMGGKEQYIYPLVNNI